MTKIIVNATNKGGEGKTTTSIHLIEYAAMIMKKKVLAIDLDPQANLSGRYIKMEYDPAYNEGKIPPTHPDYEQDKDLDWDGRSTIANIFYGEGVQPYPTSIKNIELMPSYSSKLQEAENINKKEVLNKVYNQLHYFLESSDIKKEYEIVIIDTPPAKGPLTRAAIKAATHLVIPTQMEQFSMEGMYGMMQLWKQETYVRPKERPIVLIGILPNQVRNINLHEQFYNGLTKMDGIKEYVMPFKLKKRAVYTEVLVENANPKSIFELPKTNIARKECEKACEYIIKRIYNNG